MLKRMLTLGLAIAVVSLLSTVAFAVFDYNDTGDVTITLTIPVILVLDMGEKDSDIVWLEITAADLDQGHVIRNSATSFTVDSNDPDGFEVTVYAIQHFTSSGQTFSISNLSWKSHLVNDGDFETPPTVYDTAWDPFEDIGSGNSETVATVLNSQGADCVIMLDYKIAMTWLTVAASEYTTTLTFTLAGL